MATVVKPSSVYAVWPNRYHGPAVATGMPDVALYQELRDGPPPTIIDEGIGYFRFPTSVTRIRVLDATGLHDVAIASLTPAAFAQRLASGRRQTKPR